jgi:hypothetical protein
MQSVSLRIVLSVVAGAVTLGIGLPLRAASLHVTETLTDRCSVQVQVKNPYANDSNSIDPSDVLLDRNGNLGTVGSAMEAGHYEKIGSNGFSNWSALIAPVPANSDHYFRWYCGPTAERSRCPSDTKGIKVRIGPGRLFETQCMK